MDPLSQVLQTEPQLLQIEPGDSCLLCDSAAEFVGFFEPSDPQRFGAPEGKLRYIRYCVCRRCMSDARTLERAEKIIEYEFCSTNWHKAKPTPARGPNRRVG